MLRRSFVVVLLVLLATACGDSKQEPAVSVGQLLDHPADVVVTRDCGKTTVVKKTGVAAGQTAMRALDRVAEIETDDGGKFVTAINDVEQDVGKKLAWLYYINGKAAQKGATEIRLAAGDVEWWDLHNYEHECATIPPEAQ